MRLRLLQDNCGHSMKKSSLSNREPEQDQPPSKPLPVQMSGLGGNRVKRKKKAGGKECHHASATVQPA